MTEEQIAERLAAAVQTGELPSDYSAEQGAHDAVNAMLSLAARARVGSSRDDLIGDAASATALFSGYRERRDGRSVEPAGRSAR